jgi:hypothetical protein
VLFSTEKYQTFSDKLPLDFNFSGEHDVIDVLIELKGFDDNLLMFAHIKVVEHGE